MDTTSNALELWCRMSSDSVFSTVYYISGLRKVEVTIHILSENPVFLTPVPGTNFETEINGTANILEQVKEYINLHPEVKEKIEEYQVNRLGSSPAKCNNAELEALQPPGKLLSVEETWSKREVTIMIMKLLPPSVSC
jgi:hypothetical protein